MKTLSKDQRKEVFMIDYVVDPYKIVNPRQLVANIIIDLKPWEKTAALIDFEIKKAFSNPLNQQLQDLIVSTSGQGYCMIRLGNVLRALETSMVSALSSKANFVGRMTLSIRLGSQTSTLRYHWDTSLPK